MNFVAKSRIINRDEINLEELNNQLTNFNIWEDLMNLLNRVHYSSFVLKFSTKETLEMINDQHLYNFPKFDNYHVSKFLKEVARAKDYIQDEWISGRDAKDRICELVKKAGPTPLTNIQKIHHQLFSNEKVEMILEYDLLIKIEDHIHYMSGLRDRASSYGKRLELVRCLVPYNDEVTVNFAFSKMQIEDFENNFENPHERFAFAYGFKSKRDLMIFKLAGETDIKFYEEPKEEDCA